MTTYFDGLLPLTFGGQKLVFLSYDVAGKYSHSEHVYPKSAGPTVPEKTQREAYRVNVTLKFDSSRYSEPIDTVLGKLRDLFESGETKKLQIPHIGTIWAFCEGWNESVSAAYKSGLDVKLSFVEDELEPPELFVAAKAKGIGDAMSKLKAAASAAPPDAMSLLDKLDAVVTQILQIQGEAQMGLLLLESKIQTAVNLILELDGVVTWLQDPGQHLIIDALMNLWSALDTLARDLAGEGSEMKVWTTPRQMTAQEVSLKLYGDTAHETDIMALNMIEDPYTIRAGTKLRYYP